MFEVLVYLFETYIHDKPEMYVDQNTLTADLAEIGFHRDDIFEALNWLKSFSEFQEEDRMFDFFATDSSAMRIYTEKEMACMDPTCRGFLLFLEQRQILTGSLRELIIDRVMALEGTELIFDDLKWVVLMVLLNIPGNEDAYKSVEALFGPLH